MHSAVSVSDLGGQLFVLEVGDHVGDRHRVAGGLGDAKADAAQDVAPIGLDHLHDRGLDDVAVLLDVLEHRRLGHLGADDQPDDDQEDAARNGTRQAQSPPRCTLTKNTRLASSSPTGKPACTMPV